MLNARVAPIIAFIFLNLYTYIYDIIIANQTGIQNILHIINLFHCAGGDFGLQI